MTLTLTFSEFTLVVFGSYFGGMYLATNLMSATPIADTTGTFVIAALVLVLAIVFLRVAKRLPPHNNPD